MVTCKKCIHYEKCKSINVDFADSANPKRICHYFKNKADVAEVVICQDCKWWIGERCLNPNGAYNCVTGPYWFCKSGQRREKENEQ